MSLTIPARFNGPTSSGNGGWTAGSLAAELRDAAGVTGPITVRLSAPPPLDRPMDVEVTTAEDGADVVATLSDGATIVATAVPAVGWTNDPVAAVDVRAAEVAASSYVDPARHPFPHCFVCGPARQPGDGMRLTPGRLEAGGTACVWRPADTLDGAPLGEPWFWSALDCPGGWSSDILGRPMVLGTITAQVLEDVDRDDDLVVAGHLDRSQGRRSWTSTAIWRGELLVARAEAVWLEVDAVAFNAIRA